MTLYFAYGINMDRALMRLLCPNAVPLGPARLEGWCFRITTSGYASIVPKPGGVVHGVLWRLSARDRAVLDAYEDLDSGYYRRRILPVHDGRRMLSALVYVGRNRSKGRAKPRYQEAIIGAARDWALPERHVTALMRWLPSGSSAKRRVKSVKIRERS